MQASEAGRGARARRGTRSRAGGREGMDGPEPMPEVVVVLGEASPPAGWVTPAELTWPRMLSSPTSTLIQYFAYPHPPALPSSSCDTVWPIAVTLMPRQR